MKNLFLLCLLFVMFRPVDGHTILGLSVYPVAPTSQDTVYAIMDCAFNSGSCEMVSGGVTGMTGNQIELAAYHCTGPLTVICYETDTISLGVLPAGNYVLTANLFVGNDITISGSCDVFAQADQDTTVFTVSPFTDLPSVPARTPLVVFNGSQRALQVESDAWPVRVALRDAAGRLLQETALREPGKVDLSGLPVGIYFYSVSAENGSSLTGKFILD